MLKEIHRRDKFDTEFGIANDVSKEDSINIDKCKDNNAK